MGSGHAVAPDGEQYQSELQLRRWRGEQAGAFAAFAGDFLRREAIAAHQVASILDRECSNLSGEARVSARSTFFAAVEGSGIAGVGAIDAGGQAIVVGGRADAAAALLVEAARAGARGVLLPLEAVKGSAERGVVLAVRRVVALMSRELGEYDRTLLGSGAVRRATDADYATIQVWVERRSAELGLQQSFSQQVRALRGACAEGRVRVLVDGDELKAMLSLAPASSGVVRISDVYTPESLRGRGFAKQLLIGVLAILARSGFRSAALYVDEEREGVRQLYEKIGFAYNSLYVDARVSVSCRSPITPRYSKKLYD